MRNLLDALAPRLADLAELMLRIGNIVFDDIGDKLAGLGVQLTIAWAQAWIGG